MNPILARLASDESTIAVTWRAGVPQEFLLALLLASVVVLPILGGLSYLGYYVFSLPLRRRERARLFLDLIETGLQSGQGLEQTVLSAAKQGVEKLDANFSRFAGRLTEGLGFAQAIELTPGLLPPPVAAMLRAGAELGDIRKTLPSCRRLLHDAATPLLKAQHYLMLLMFVTSPMWIAVFCMLTVFVVPKLVQIHYDMAEGPPGGLMTFLIEWGRVILLCQVTLVLSLWFGAVLYWGGPRLKSWFTRRLPLPWSDLALRIPWQRNRLLRDFATLLGVALDAGLPEPRAVLLAADGSANEVFRRRAVAVMQDLRDGLKLPRALRRMDAGGELEWRLENAAAGDGGFAAALAGWEEALDARAFQQEQVTAQVFTTGLVLLNGVLVALLTAGVFQMLTRLVWDAVLW
jgi:type II secretory pathway component PulF